MFFTELGRVAAGLAFVLGVAGVAVGFNISIGEEVTKDGYKFAEMLINNGFICLLFAIVTGVFTDISKSLAKGDKGEAE